MRFIIQLNEPEENGSITLQAIETGTDNHRSNKKILRSYFKQLGVPVNQIKGVMKSLGFWGARLGS